MLDPYLVLGVGKYDDDQTVKKAYRQLSKQYHPDNNLNNPNKDAAEETFKKIQQAYEQIMHERSIGIGGPNDVRRKQNESSSGSSSGYENRSSYTSNNSYQSGSSGSSNGSGYYGGKTEYKSKDRYNDDWYKNSAYNSTNNYSNGSNGNSGYSSGNTSGDSSGNNSGYRSGNSSGYGSGNSSGYGSGSYTDYGSGNSSGYYGSGSNNSSDNFSSGYGGANGSSGYYSGSYSSNGYGQSYGSGYYSGNTDSFFTEDTNGLLNNVAKELNQKNFFEAWDILNSMQNRNDVWYYYSAIANLGLGNSITALSHARKAKEMDPTRPEYDELINGIQSGALHYQGKSDMFVPQKANKGNICLKLIIANIALNIFCGGGGVLCHGFCGMC